MELVNKVNDIKHVILINPGTINYFCLAAPHSHQPFYTVWYGTKHFVQRGA